MKRFCRAQAAANSRKASALRQSGAGSYVRFSRLWCLKKETLEGGYANVESVVVGGNSDTSIDDRLHEVNGRWRVYDMVIDQVSLIGNFRAQFEREISRTSVQGLIEKIKQRQSYNAP
jgi:hypothetical protein